MSQLGAYGATVKHHSGVLLNDFGYLLLTTAVAQNFKVGELITGGTSGVTAKVSGIADPGINKVLRLKAIKVRPGTDTLQFFTDAETITGGTSSTTATTGTSCFTFSKKALRQDSTKPTLSTTNVAFAASGKTLTRGAGSWITDGIVIGAKVNVAGTASNNVNFTVTAITSATVIVVAETVVDENANSSAVVKLLAESFVFDTITMDDRGINIAHRNTGGTVTRPQRGKEVRYAMRMAASKSQISDTSVVPVTSWTMPAAGSYSVAGATVMRFVLVSNEDLVVTGSPRVAIVDSGPSALTTTSIAFVAATKTLTRVGGSWITDSVQVGSSIAITGTASNNATFTVATVSALSITVVESVVDEAANASAAAAIQAATVYAYYRSGVSDRRNLVFEYITTRPVIPGQIASATYGANSGTIVDIGGAAGTITPASMGSVTGILFAA